MGLGIATAVVGAIGSGRSNKKLKKLLNKAPKYKITDEAYENQALAKSQAFGRDRSIQSQEQNISQEAANTVAQAKDITSSTSELLGTLAAINANKTQAFRGLAQDEAGMQNQKMQQLYGANQAMIDEKDKAWNYNENMPYQMKVAALRDKAKFNQELMMKGIESQATTDAAAIQSVGQMFGAVGGAMSDERIKEKVEPTEYGLDEVGKFRVVNFEYKHEIGRHVGLIAQEAQQIIPESVKESNLQTESGYPLLKIDYNEIVPVLIKSIQELSAQVKALQSEISSIKQEA